jgi:serine/threonine protein kinase
VSKADAPSVLSPGTLLGNTYIIEGHLARGGIGEIYRARHVELGTEHAIQVMLPSPAEDPKIVPLFREEARKLGRIKNDAVVDYQGFFRDERGLRYLVTEFVHGERLAEVLFRRRLEPDEVLRLRDRLALGLAAAHELDIIHRDVSPENILLPEGRIDRAKLIGFGIAKSTDPAALTIIGSDLAGKYSYISPEQVGLFGGRVDLRSDIYSLGLVLAAAAIGFGRKLDMGNSPPTAIAARQRVPDLTEVPASLRPVIAPMLEPRPHDRLPSLRALSSDEGAASDAPTRRLAEGGDPSEHGKPIQFYSCFISYSAKDQIFTDRLHGDLQNKGVRCWFAPHDLAIGAKIWDAIDQEIRLRDKLLLVLSKASIASEWVEDEVNKAYAEERSRKEVVLFPIRIDNTVISTDEPWAVKLRERNIGDFRQWRRPGGYQKGLERLLRDLKASGDK